MLAQEAPERRNLYRRFMSGVRYDQGWITGPVYFLTTKVPGLAGLAGVVVFSERVVEELTLDRPLLLARAIAAAIPSELPQAIPAISEIITTGDFKRAGLFTLGAVGSAVVVGIAAYFEGQAELGMKDAQEADFRERQTRYSLQLIH